MEAAHEQDASWAQRPYRTCNASLLETLQNLEHTCSDMSALCLESENFPGGDFKGERS